MRTSVICLPSNARLRAAGFTLVELLVVMLIMGLLASVTVPNLKHLFDSVQRDAQRETALGAITGLSYRAYVTGAPITLVQGRSVPHSFRQQARDPKAAPDAPAPPPVDDLVFPDGWQLELPQPIEFNFLGICSGGKLKLLAPDGGEESFVLKGPRCDVALPPEPV